jgi:hypothetical protein
VPVATEASSPAETWAFGIEIECFMPADKVFTRGRYHHGRQVRAIDRWTAEGWTAEADSSVVSDRPGFVGVEIVSPKLTGEEGLIEVVAMIDWLAEIGAYVNQRCGQHVSVDARGLSNDQVLKVRETFKALEPGLYLVNGDQAAERWRNDYCTPLSSGRTAMAARYWGLNLVNYSSSNHDRKRLEFRLWAGTLDAAKTVSYILTSVGFMAGVTAGDVPTPAEIPADALGQLRLLTHKYVIGHRMLPADKVSDLTDICRDMVTTGKAGVSGLVAVAR